MTDYQIPLHKVPNQSVSCVLSEQPCVIVIRLLGENLYLSLSQDGVPICQNVLLVDRSAIVRAAYTGFIGDLIVIDRYGEANPDWRQWGERFLLLYNPEGYEING